jgi:hypothetical protein
MPSTSEIRSNSKLPRQDQLEKEDGIIAYDNSRDKTVGIPPDRINTHVPSVIDLASVSQNGPKIIFAGPDKKDGGIFVQKSSDPFGNGSDEKIVVRDSSNTTWWVRQKALSGVIKVEWFGAEGDGTTDDTQAFQDADVWARNSLRSAKIVLASDSEYIVDQINLQTDGLVLDLNGQRLKQKGGVSPGIDSELLRLNGSRMVVKNGSLDVNKSNLSDKFSGVHVTGSTAEGCVVKNIDVLNSARHGVHFEDTFDGYCENIRVFDPDRDGLSIEKSERCYAKGIRVFRSTGRGAVEIVDGSRDVYVQNIYGEDLEYCLNLQTHGESNHDLQRITVENIRADNVDWIIKRFDDISQGYDHRDLTIRDIKADSGSFPSAPTGQAIALYGWKNVTLEDITLYDYNDGQMVLFVECDEVKLSDIKVARDSGTSPRIILADCSFSSINKVEGRLLDSQIIEIKAESNTRVKHDISGVIGHNNSNSEDILISEAGGTMDQVYIHDNISVSITDNSSGSSVVSDNQF